MNRRNDHDFVSRLRTPRAPDELKPRVLQRAVDALESGVRPALAERLWESRPLRATWAVAMTGLIVAHITISVPREWMRPSRPDVTADRDQIDDLRRVLALPSVEISPRAEAIVMGRRDPGPERTRKPRGGSRANEVPS